MNSSQKLGKCRGQDHETGITLCRSKNKYINRIPTYDASPYPTYFNCRKERKVKLTGSI